MSIKITFNIQASEPSEIQRITALLQELVAEPEISIASSKPLALASEVIITGIKPLTDLAARIRAIRALRNATNLGLRQAKAKVEDWEAGVPDHFSFKPMPATHGQDYLRDLESAGFVMRRLLDGVEL